MSYSAFVVFKCNKWWLFCGLCVKIDHCKEEAEKRKMMRAKCIMMVADKDLFIQRLHENRKQLLQVRACSIDVLAVSRK